MNKFSLALVCFSFFLMAAQDSFGRSPWDPRPGDPRGNDDATAQTEEVSAESPEEGAL